MQRNLGKMEHDEDTYDLRYRKNGDMYKCQVCNKEFRSRCGAKYHISATHTDVRYFCGQCDKRFILQQNLKRHVDIVHMGKKYLCDQCDHQSTQLGYLKMHIISKHTKTEEGKLKIKLKKPLKTEFKCSLCEKVFKTANGARVHKKSVHYGIQFSCEHCGKFFSQKCQLGTHIQSVHKGRKFICDLCDYQVTKNVYLKRHIKFCHLDQKGINGKKEDEKMETFHHYSVEHDDNSMVRAEKECLTMEEILAIGNEGKIPSKKKRVVKDNKYYKKYKPVKVGDQYKCEDCDKEFKSVPGAQVHKRTVHEGISYDCHLCERKFSQQNNLKTHIQHKHEGHFKKYKCGLCEYWAKKNVTLKRHIQNFHIHQKVQLSLTSKTLMKKTSDYEEKSIHEENNLNGLQRRSNLKYSDLHHDEEEKKESEIVNEEINEENNCNQEVNLEASKVEIILNTENAIEPCTSLKGCNYSQKETKESIFIEELPGMLESNPPVKKEEVKEVELQKEEFSSDSLDSTDTTETDTQYLKDETKNETKTKNKIILLEKYKPTKAGNKYKCLDCDKEFTSVMGAKIHKRTVHEGVRYDCHICERQFSQQSNLKTHIQQKHEDKKETFTCTFCYQKCATKRNVNRHMKLKHHKEFIAAKIKYDSLSCDSCDYVATKAYSLSVHKRDKHSEQVFYCDQCSFNACIKSNLKRHIKRQHVTGDMHSCDKCGQQFTQLTNLKIHIQSVHEGMKFSCPHCDFQASQKGNLNTHIKLKH